MRGILFLAAISISLGATGQVLAQGGGAGFGGGTGMGGGGTSFGGGGGGTSFAGGGTSISGGTSFAGGGTSISGGTSFAGGGTGFTGMTGGSTVPGRTGAGGRSTGGAGVTISPTNFLSASYGNPLYPGRPGSTNIAPAAGGFGQPSFGSTTTGGRTQTGGRAGMGGGTASVSSNFGRLGLVNSPITFATVVRFPMPRVQAPQVQTQLQALIDRSAALKLPGAVRVEVQGNKVILRGRAADDDDRRLVEGMVRLEPGVHQVINELRVP